MNKIYILGSIILLLDELGYGPIILDTNVIGVFLSFKGLGSCLI